MLTELYEMLPEAGDLDKPKLAFFFDEAHLLFDGAPKALVDKVEQVVRLIRSKGVSVWFITQNPADLPDSVLGQIGNRVQHALRAYTPKDQKALRAAAQSFRANKNFDTEEALQALGVGQALISVLDEEGVPSVVEQAGVMPPRSSMKAASPEDIAAAVKNSPMAERYNDSEDRRSAYEMLEEVRAEAQEQAEREAREAEKEKLRQQKEKERAAASRSRSTSSSSRSTSTKKRQSTLEKTVNKTLTTAANTVGRELGKQLIRGLFGNVKR